MKQITLTRGMFTMVDDADYDWLNQWKWHTAKHGKKFYASRRPTKRGKSIHMHRLIMGIPRDPNIFADHKDRDGLNNQRHNLRIANRSQNNSNRTPMGASKFLGVFPSQSKINPWFARINKNKKRYYLGSFPSESAAALAYNKAAIELHGEFANLNVIEPAANIYSAAS